jgi:hypothetical protein
MRLKALAKQPLGIWKGAMSDNFVGPSQRKQNPVPVGLRTIRADNSAQDAEKEICGRTLKIKDCSFGITNDRSMVAGFFRDFARKPPLNQRSLYPFSVLVGHGESVHLFSPPVEDFSDYSPSSSVYVALTAKVSLTETIEHYFSGHRSSVRSTL